MINVQRKGTGGEFPLSDANSVSMHGAPCALASSEMNVDLPQPDDPTTAMAISLGKRWVTQYQNLKSVGLASAYRERYVNQ